MTKNVTPPPPARAMTVAELIERLRQADVGADWPVYLNPYGENLDLAEIQIEAGAEYVVLVTP